jgi:ankyrin repeat protein
LGNFSRNTIQGIERIKTVNPSFEVKSELKMYKTSEKYQEKYVYTNRRNTIEIEPIP